MIRSFFGKPCFGTYKCWTHVRNKCPMATECKLKRQAEDLKALRDGKAVMVGRKIVQTDRRRKCHTVQTKKP